MAGSRHHGTLFESARGRAREVLGGDSTRFVIYDAIVDMAEVKDRPIANFNVRRLYVATACGRSFCGSVIEEVAKLGLLHFAGRTDAHGKVWEIPMFDSEPREQVANKHADVWTRPNLGKHANRVYDAIERGASRQPEVVAYTGISRQAVHQQVNRLCEAGLIERVGRNVKVTGMDVTEWGTGFRLAEKRRKQAERERRTYATDVLEIDLNAGREDGEPPF